MIEWLFIAKEQFRPLDEGEVFTRKLNLDQLLALRASAKKGNHEIMKTSLEHIMKMFKHKNIGFFSNFTEERWSRVITEACHDVSKTSSMMLCTPRRLGKLISKVFLDEGLYGEQRLMLDEAMRRLKIFQIFWRLIDEEPMSSPPADTPKRNVQHEHNKHHTDEIGWGANMFTIVSLKSNIAISYISSLGSQFGSRADCSNQYYLNDLGRYKEPGNYERINGLFPSVARSKSKINFAYAAIGGTVAQTRSFPRTITSYLLNIFHGINLTSTLGWPLLYYSDGTAYKDGVPFA
ncbi:hypothetical protein GCK32_010701, partial [Trichostrongylus colubriformis]